MMEVNIGADSNRQLAEKSWYPDVTIGAAAPVGNTIYANLGLSATTVTGVNATKLQAVNSAGGVRTVETAPPASLLSLGRS